VPAAFPRVFLIIAQLLLMWYVKTHKFSAKLLSAINFFLNKQVIKKSIGGFFKCIFITYCFDIMKKAFRFFPCHEKHRSGAENKNVKTSGRSNRG
jgi:hypothetical protein